MIIWIDIILILRLQKIQDILKKSAIQNLSSRPEHFNDIGYTKAIVEVLKINREAWETQPTEFPKDRIQKGYIANELFSLLPKFSQIELHAALDYCFDFHYLAVFRKRDSSGFSRCYRTTEISGGLLLEEIYGAAVIYSFKTPTPDWLINKVFPIIRNIKPGLIYDGHLVISKAYFGDITRIKQSEESYMSWKDVQTELWDIEEFGSGVRYRKKDDTAVVEKVKEVMNDERLSGFRDTLTAIIFLLENCGRDAAILLDILTPGYGGVDYITYNLSQILSLGIKKPDHNTTKTIEWHSKGADEKLNILLDLFEKQDTLLDKLSRRCTRLQQTYLIQVQAEKAVSKARPFTSRILYDTLSKLKNGISDAVIAARQNNYHGFVNALNSIGIYQIKQSQNLRNLLSHVAQDIYPTLYAISGQVFPWEYYTKYVITQQDSFKYILGYDLTSERRKAVPEGDELTRNDDKIHKFIANWIISFKGKLSASGMNAGDLRFGFFNNIDEAISAGCWLLHHIDQLKEANTFSVGSESIGIVITSGTYKIDPIGNASGQIFDMSGHWLKGEIIERNKLDAATAIVGRETFQFHKSQAWILEHSSFEIDKSNRQMIGKPMQLEYNQGNINLSPIDIDEFLQNSPTPWIETA